MRARLRVRSAAQEVFLGGAGRHRLGRGRYKSFLREFLYGDVYVYRDMLRETIGMKTYLLEIDIDHLLEFDDVLTTDLLSRPAFHLPLFETAALEVAVQNDYITDIAAEEADVAIQVTLTSTKQPSSIRKMLSEQVSKVVTVPGILISASKVKAKATSVFAQCQGCQNIKQIPVRAGFAGAQLPRVCDKPRQPNEPPCGLDPYQIMPEKCKYVDQQTWKLQEAPESVPTGEMPRTVLMTVDRRLVDRASPGNRITVTGILSVMSQDKGGGGKVAVRQSYLQVLGVRHGFESRTSEGESLSEFTQEEEEKFHEMARDPELNDKIFTSIAPSIFGTDQDQIKKAISCLLFSGAQKNLADGARLRGDINVLLLGDPSCGKSQFLKFVEKAAPVCVYTSGKGSSAAGLTATVTQDAGTREFYLEGGAMVIADGGVVCIDEFDKMREQDRVAIHEAMEQQTISIAKAGITTVLNSRTAVLAAANPTFGRYDDAKNAAEQVDFQTTILSRFDMIFILKDQFNAEKDAKLAQHIINVHTQGGGAVEAEAREDEIDVRTLKRYIAFARKTCHPRLDESGTEVLQNYYVSMRQDLHEADEEGEANGKPGRAVPITVRQLEALIRIAESFAKMRLSEVATEQDVNNAIELFTVSTLEAAKQGDIQLEGGAGTAEHTAAQMISKRLRIGEKIETEKLVRELVFQTLDERAVRRAVNALVRKGELQETKQGRKVQRLV
mmetsp:Transcript_23840/g.55291  ORF Transcript_23840/g.55291 Transcript_23840/m.55291 type:complete len:726 (-) Transcript_23840:550-2727(-)